MGAADEGLDVVSETVRDVERETLPLRTKLGFAFGDHTLSIALATVSLYYLYFLTEIVGLRPGIAAFVLLLGRSVDAITDPAMGLLSDRTRSPLGRRRLYFALGAIPFGLSFALMWRTVPAGDPWSSGALYAAAFTLHTLAYTVLAVPYFALLPEMARGYHERTAMNIYRYAGTVIGLLIAAVATRPLVEAVGGGAAGYARVGVVLGAWIALPWFVVLAVSWERPETWRPSALGFAAGMQAMFRHGAYRRLIALFVSSRIAIDIVGATLIFYFDYWLGRPGDFAIGMGVLFVADLLSLPLWMRLSRIADKKAIFIAGGAWWLAVQVLFFNAQPTWPRWQVFALMAAIGIGFAAVDFMPWSMLGDVIDEDELNTGERREGLYSGAFTFLRKLGGAGGAALAGVILDIAGFQRGVAQSETSLWAIRGLAGLVPLVFVGLALVIARGYSISRLRHEEILAVLARRGRPDGAP